MALENKPKPVISDPGDAIVKIMVPTDNKGGGTWRSKRLEYPPISGCATES
jgi:hypothetical protein